MFVCYTDGATSNNGKKNPYGGYGVAMIEKSDETGEVVNTFDFYGPVTGEKVTNNVCELSAVVMALHSILGTHPVRSTILPQITIYTDSAYIANCFKDKWYVNWQNNGWVNSKKKPVENKGLWEEILHLMDFAFVTIEKVKGHAGNEFNERADELARQGAKEAKQIAFSVNS